METRIIDFLKKKYNPVSIVLFGSRSSNLSYTTSDWDFLLFVEQSTNVESQVFEGQNVDLDAVCLPSSANDLLKKFDGALQNARVITDTTNSIEKLIGEVKEIYKNGRNLTKDELKSRLNFINRRLSKMEGNLHNPGVFFFHVSIFYEKALQYWFEIEKNRWKVSPALALQIVDAEDKNYFELLKTFYTDGIPAEKKVKAAYDVVTILNRKSNEADQN